MKKGSVRDENSASVEKVMLSFNSIRRRVALPADWKKLISEDKLAVLRAIMTHESFGGSSSDDSHPEIKSILNSVEVARVKKKKSSIQEV